jgi:hypothetical protein
LFERSSDFEIPAVTWSGLGSGGDLPSFAVWQKHIARRQTTLGITRRSKGWTCRDWASGRTFICVLTTKNLVIAGDRCEGSRMK